MLLGYSSGGWMVNAVTALLEKEGGGPAAVVLLDTYTARRRWRPRTTGSPSGRSRTRTPTSPAATSRSWRATRSRRRSMCEPGWTPAGTTTPSRQPLLDNSL
ncbi:hypothetical protein G3H79_00880 [Streptomyces aureoverticillatus]|nr:hypothetical protein G3H79_00880 [Streptomyces aureoverticillatus]